MDAAAPLDRGSVRRQRRQEVRAVVLDDHMLRQELAAERSARLAAERERRRLELLTEISERFAETLDPVEALRLLSELLVPRLGQWCATYLLDDDGSIAHVIGYHARIGDSSVAADLHTYTSRAADTLTSGTSIKRVLRNELSEALIVRMDRSTTGATVDGDPQLTDVFERLGMGSAIVAPLRSRNRLLGAFHLTGGTERTDYTAEDVALVVQLARRAALALDNARLYARERSIAETLQRSLLPRLPHIPGLRLDAEYLPATTGASVGGDWFDVMLLPGGATGLVIGDVMGHDIAAAASMGQLRSALRSYAWEGAEPDDVLDRLDRLMQGLGVPALASCVYARVETAAPDGRRLVRWSNAGHVPPLLRHVDATVDTLDGNGLLLGVTGIDGERRLRPVGSVVVEPGATLLLYTDGIVEDPGTVIDVGISRLAAALQDADPNRDPVCAELTAQLHDAARRDDIALLAVTID